jgi:phenylpropionate dioxygenase-like ring-hydroxylating dioxygenase large terminal subunit
MVHIPSRLPHADTPEEGEVPVRLGPSVDNVPGHGATRMSRAPYADPIQFELERERVLNTTWLLAGRVEQLEGPGDWLTFESHGETVIVARQDDGSLAAFHNVCMHRGPALVPGLTGCGAKEFKCQYHGWTYDLTGKVKGVPERRDFNPDHLDGLRSPEVAVDVWGGWIWLNLAGPERATPLADWIGTDIIDDLGRFKMEQMRLHEVLEFDVDVSYKAIVDGFNEIYHATELHQVPTEWTKSARDTTFWTVNEHNYMCFVPRYEHRDELAKDWDHHKWAICHYVVFPNTVFNCNPDHIQVFQPIPVDVDRTRFLCWELIYDGDDADPEYREYLERTMRHWQGLQRVVGEDIDIYTQLARTKRSSAYTHNILNEREYKLAHYHDTMARMIRD